MLVSHLAHSPASGLTQCALSLSLFSRTELATTPFQFGISHGFLANRAPFLARSATTTILFLTSVFIFVRTFLHEPFSRRFWWPAGWQRATLYIRAPPPTGRPYGPRRCGGPRLPVGFWIGEFPLRPGCRLLLRAAEGSTHIGFERVLFRRQSYLLWLHRLDHDDLLIRNGTQPRTLALGFGSNLNRVETFMTSRMPPVPPANRSQKGSGLENDTPPESSTNHPGHQNISEKGETANIKQNTTNEGYFRGRRTK
jgi:hypothetical protein